MHTRRAIYRPSEQDRHPSSVTYHKQPTAQSVKQAHSFLEPNRSSFPPGFIFGTASAAYQYEGAAYEYGRGPCIWDTYTHKFPGNIADGSNGDVANDSYHKYKEDVRLMKEMGIDAYRFSISWSRLLPYGKLSKGVNEKGIMYYHNLLDELEANGIKPFVTLFHCDAPQYLQDEYDGFLSPNIVDDYRDYTDLCFREFGDKVKNWITFNEPFVFCTEWYKVGLMSAKKCHSVDAMNNDPATMPYLTAHHMLLAHAAAVDLYRKEYQESQNGIIGITLNTNWVVPNSSTWEDFEATQRAIDWMFGWFMDPVTYGDYPYSMQSLVGDRLPTFTEEQSRLLKGSYDFLGLNYYTSNFAADAPELAEQEPCYTNDLLAKTSYERNGVPIGPKATSQWLYIYPKGLFDLLLYIKRKYKNPTIYITENGVDEPNDSQLCHEEALIDIIRVQYYHGHLSFLECAINKHGVNVKGYFAWSLLDNFEWETGYTVRFGLHYVDYEDGQKRYPKLSAKWFKKILQPKQANLKITM